MHVKASKYEKDKEEGKRVPSRRPCDWCGKPLARGEKFIHTGNGPNEKLKGSCYDQEDRYYTALGYDGEPPDDIKLPEGYVVVIPPRLD